MTTRRTVRRVPTPVIPAEVQEDPSPELPVADFAAINKEVIKVPRIVEVKEETKPQKILYVSIMKGTTEVGVLEYKPDHNKVFVNWSRPDCNASIGYMITRGVAIRNPDGTLVGTVDPSTQPVQFMEELYRCDLGKPFTASKPWS